MSSRLLGEIGAACQEHPTYLDRYYALQPGRPNGAKRLIVLLPISMRDEVDPEWRDETGECATVVWHGEIEPPIPETKMEPYEYGWVSGG
jgi:hypothetical protein